MTPNPRFSVARAWSLASTLSSFWVGIGGYSTRSTGREQDGTELGCNANGTQTVSAWYELLPAAPHTVSMAVRGGRRPPPRRGYPAQG